MLQADKTLLLNCFKDPEKKFEHLATYKEELASVGSTTVGEMERFGSFSEAFQRIIEELSAMPASTSRDELVEVARSFLRREQSISQDAQRASFLTSELAGSVIDGVFTGGMPPSKNGTLISVCVNCIFDDPGLITTRARDMVITMYMKNKLRYAKQGMTVHPITHEIEYVFAGPVCADPEAKAAKAESELAPRVKGLRYVRAQLLLSPDRRASKAAKAVSLAGRQYAN